MTSISRFAVRGEQVLNYVKNRLNRDDVSTIANTNMGVNGSVTPVEFEFYASKPCTLARIIVSIRDTSISPTDYGGIAGGLTNGLLVQQEDSNDNVIAVISPAALLKTNYSWSTLCYDYSLNTGVGDDFAAWRFTFANSGRLLYLAEGDRFVVYVTDDLSGLTDHRILVHGFYTDGAI